MLHFLQVSLHLSIGFRGFLRLGLQFGCVIRMSEKDFCSGRPELRHETSSLGFSSEFTEYGRVSVPDVG